MFTRQEQTKKSIFKTYMIYFISMSLFCIMRIAVAEGFLSSLDATWQDVVATIIIQVLIMFLIPMLLYCTLIKVKPKSLFKTCNFSKVNTSTVLISFGLGICMFFITIAVSAVFNGIISFFGYQVPLSFGVVEIPQATFGMFCLDVLLVAVLPALGEEFLHRGVVLQGTKHEGFGKAIVFSSILFGLMHLNISQVSYAIVLGLIMGFASVVAKNIWVPIIMHFTNNFIAVYLDYAAENGWFGGDFYEKLAQLSNSSMLVVFLICFVVLLAIACLMIYLILQLFKQNILLKVNRAINDVYAEEGQAMTDDPIVLQKSRMLQQMLEENTLLNLNYEAMKSPIEIVMPKQKIKYKTAFKDHIFLIASIILGGLVTLFTLIWGFI